MRTNIGFFGNNNTKKYDCRTDHKLVRPELSFTVQEIAKRFTLQNVILQGQNSNPIYNGDSSDTDFDQPAVNPSQGYDLIDARNDTLRVLKARQDYLASVRNKNRNPSIPLRSTSDSTQERSENGTLITEQ